MLDRDLAWGHFGCIGNGYHTKLVYCKSYHIEGERRQNIRAEFLCKRVGSNVSRVIYFRMVRLPVVHDMLAFTITCTAVSVLVFNSASAE